MRSLPFVERIWAASRVMNDGLQMQAIRIAQRRPVSRSDTQNRQNSSQISLSPSEYGREQLLKQ
jgi:hypothetical protein